MIGIGDLGLVMVYMIIAPSITLAYKFIFSTLRFHYPLTTVWVLFVFEWIIVALVRRFILRRGRRRHRRSQEGASARTGEAGLFWNTMRRHDDSEWGDRKIGADDDANEDDDGCDAYSTLTKTVRLFRRLCRRLHGHLYRAVGNDNDDDDDDDDDEEEEEEPPHHPRRAEGRHSQPERRRRTRFAAAVGLLLAAEIGCSNLSLLTLSVSFHTMAKAST